MGRRTSPGRSLPGNTVGGVLRDTRRSARAATRRVLPSQASQRDSEAVAGVTPIAPAATLLVTGERGLASWTLPRHLSETPVAIVATVQALHPHTVTVASLRDGVAVLLVFDAYGADARPGTMVHVMALPADRLGTGFGPPNRKG